MNEFERAQGGVHRVDLAFEPLDLRRDDAQRPGGAAAVLRRAEIGAEIEQIVLYPGQHRVGLRVAAVWSRAKPIAALTSSTVPYASTRKACFATRLPSPSDVSPRSPPRV